jgi:hypothetical protein
MNGEGTKRRNSRVHPTHKRIIIYKKPKIETTWTLLYHGTGCSMYSSTYHLVRVMLSRLEVASLSFLAENSTAFWGIPFYPFLSLSIPFYPFLSLSISFYLFLSLSIHFHPFLSLSPIINTILMSVS